MKRVIFHLPVPLVDNPSSGSQMRPLMIINAFRNLGYEVDIVSGYANERKNKIKKIKDNIKAGVHYDFLYSESSTMPTLLTEKHHLPLSPFLDFNFFRFCKQNNIKIGLFYRDIYWVFPEYYKVSAWKKVFSLYFYKYDLRKYKDLLDVLFLPSLQMYEYLPVKMGENTKVKALYPGMKENDVEEVKQKDNDDVNILYVGGIGNLYDMREMFRSIKNLKGISLTVCVRKEEWEREKHNYEGIMSNNITVIHKNGKELIPYYNKAEIASIFLKPVEYRKFAMPIKLFEYLGFHKPVLAVKGTAVGNFVEQNDVGWVIDYNKTDLSSLLLSIKENRNSIETKRINIKKIIPFNTWEARAKQIINDING